MPPVNTSAPVPDADAEITAELPVLDVAAYEATLGDSSSHADSWSVSAEAHAPPASDVTVVMPAVSAPKHDIDHSGTHEMPALPSKKAAKKSKHAPPTLVESAPISVRPAAAPATPAFSSSMPAPSVLLPPSPPLIEELRGALAAAERRIEELHEHARIADVERATAVARANGEAAQLREQLGLHLEALQTARGRLSAQGADEEGLEDELFTRGDRIAGLERELAARNATIENQAAQIESARTRADRLDVDATNLRATLAHRDSRIAILEADMLARQQREAQMKLKLADALAASDPQVPRLRSEITTRDSEVRRLAAELNELKSRLAEREQDLQVAEESIRNLEIEVRDKTAKLNEASVTVEEWRAVIAESQRSILQRDSRIQQLEGDLQKRAAAPDSAAETGQEVALEGPARVLIRTDGNTDFVHVLGRRTRIGRGPDNELVLDTKHVSRYHAVLLAGPVHTAVEDLNSTNGVFVNGRRIARQILKDGDRVTIGRTQYRYTVRPS